MQYTQVFQVRAASSFATLARGEPKDKCGYCGNHGDGGQMMMVEGYLIPRHHTACRDEILQGREAICNCPDFTGDSDTCPVHQYPIGS